MSTTADNDAYASWRALALLAALLPLRTLPVQLLTAQRTFKERLASGTRYGVHVHVQIRATDH